MSGQVIRDMVAMGFIGLAGTAASAGAAPDAAANVFPMSLLLWCFGGSFAGMGVAGPSRMRAALAELQGKTALALELMVFGVGGVLTLASTALLGFAVVNAMHLFGRLGVFGLDWAGKASPAELFPIGIIVSALLQTGAQMLLAKGVETLASWLTMFKRGGDT